MLLKEMIKTLDNSEPWTIGTDEGDRWLFYFDGNSVHNGTKLSLEEVLERECVYSYERSERKYLDEEDRKNRPYMELESGMAFLVSGRESGSI